MYTFDGRIRYSEVDAGRRLTVEKTIDYFQDCSSLPYEFKGILGMRNFMMETQSGERLATANSVWSLLDMDKMYPMRIPKELIEKYKTHPRLEMNYKPRKIAVPKEGGEQREDLVVLSHHLDTNQHMNNAVQETGNAGRPYQARDLPHRRRLDPREHER